MRFRLLPPATALAAALTCVLVLSGCMPTDDIITPPPSPSTAPIFASDEEALAAATEAYALYLAAFDTSLSTYQSNQLEKYSDESALEDAIALVKEYQLNGERQIGNAKVGASYIATAESVLGDVHPDEPVQIYVCVDLTGVDIVNSNGVSVVSANRPDIAPMFVNLKWDRIRGHFLVTEESPWDGSIDC